MIVQKPHWCAREGIICIQHENGELFLAIPCDDGFGGASEYEIEVNFCPFCGFFKNDPTRIEPDDASRIDFNEYQDTL